MKERFIGMLVLLRWAHIAKSNRSLPLCATEKLTILVLVHSFSSEQSECKQVLMSKGILNFFSSLLVKLVPCTHCLSSTLLAHTVRYVQHTIPAYMAKNFTILCACM